MIKNYLFIFSFISSICSAQVGIGITNPQKELHIAGTNSTIRIENINAVNSSANDGIKPAPAFVDSNGDISLGNGTGLTGKPFNFLIDLHNFVPDNPYGWNVTDEVNTTGFVINSVIGQSSNFDIITSIPFSVPQDALIEVKYGITLYIKGEDMSAIPPPYIDATYGQAINMVTFFCIDRDNNGSIDSSEFSMKYGEKGQYFETLQGGITGFPYMNGQGYFSLTAGSYQIFFYGVVNDHSDSYTSVGFGGLPDYLKVRIFN